MRGKKLKINVATSVVFAILRIVILLWIVRLATVAYPPLILGIFLLSRRFAATGSNIFQLGVSQTLRRYISINFNSSASKLSYLYVALLGCLVISIVILSITVSCQTIIGAWLYPGIPAGPELAVWTIAYALALVLNYIVFSSFIAERKIALGNFLDTLAAGGFMIPPLLYYGTNIRLTWLLQIHSLAVVTTSLVAVFWYVASLHTPLILDRRLLKLAFDDFRKYGTPRTFITFADMLILLIGPWLLRSHPEESGYLLIALTLTRTVQAAIQPLTQIASVVTARLTGSQNDSTLREGINLLLGITTYASTLLVAVLIPWRETLLRLWLGDTEVITGVLFYFDVLMWAIIPYAVFQSLKGVIEMRWTQPLNLYTLVVASLIYLSSYAILLYFNEPSEAIRTSTLLCFIALAAGSLICCKQYLRHPSYWGAYRLIIAATCLFAVNRIAAANSEVLYHFIALILSAAIIWIIVCLRPAPFVKDFKFFMFAKHTSKTLSCD